MSHKLLSLLMTIVENNSKRLSDEELNKLALWCDRLNGNRPADGSLRCKPHLMARVLNARTDFKPINSMSLVEVEEGKRTA